MFGTTFVALTIQSFVYLKDSSYLLLFFTVVLALLSLVMLDETRKVYTKRAKTKGILL